MQNRPRKDHCRAVGSGGLSVLRHCGTKPANRFANGGAAERRNDLNQRQNAIVLAANRLQILQYSVIQCRVDTVRSVMLLYSRCSCFMCNFAEIGLGSHNVNIQNSKSIKKASNQIVILKSNFQALAKSQKNEHSGGNEFPHIHSKTVGRGFESSCPCHDAWSKSIRPRKKEKSGDFERFLRFFRA